MSRRQSQNLEKPEAEELFENKLQTEWREFDRTPKDRRLLASGQNNSARGNCCCGFSYSTVFIAVGVSLWIVILICTLLILLHYAEWF